MDKRLLYIVIFLSTMVAVIMGFYLFGRAEARPELKITSIYYEWASYEGENQLVFNGYVANMGTASANEVIVSVLWAEFEGAEHIGSVNVGIIPKKSTKPFQIVFNLDHLITVKFYIQWVEFS